MLPLVLAAGAVHAAALNRVVTDSAFSSDSDGQHERRADVGYVRSLSGWGNSATLGLRAGYWLIDDPQRHVEFGTLRVDHRVKTDRLDINAYAAQLANADWSPTLGGFYFDYHATTRWSIEGSGDYQIVDTAVAADRHTRYNSYSLVSDYRLLDSVTLVGGVLRDWFSDGNHRIGGIARLVYSPQALPGFNVQLRYRRLHSQFRGIGYFSPGRLEETMALFKYGHAIFGDRFVASLLAGAGVQQIGGRDSSALYQAEFRIRGWFNDHLGLEGRTGCTDTGGLAARAASGGYRYCYGNLSLIAAW